MKKFLGLSKSDRILRSFEYKRAYEGGKYYRDEILVLTILKNNMDRHRLGLSISTSKVPASSKRNRLKRLIREAFRLNRARFKNGPYDIVISLAKKLPFPITYSMVETRLQKLLMRAKAL